MGCIETKPPVHAGNAPESVRPEKTQANAPSAQPTSYRGSGGKVARARRPPPEVDAEVLVMRVEGGAVGGVSLPSSPLFRDKDGDVANEFLVETASASWAVDTKVEEIRM
jgi:hypothetical protein